jgi:hypothetical protein
LTSAVLRCFIAAVTSDLRRRAQRLGFRGQLKTGAMTVVQRFGSSLALNVHFRTLAVDGVWSTQTDGSLDFHPLPAPSDHDVARIARAVCRKVDVLECPKCKGRIEILAVVTKPASVRRFLKGMGLPGLVYVSVIGQSASCALGSKMAFEILTLTAA